MELELAPVYYNQVGVTSPNCMKILPSSTKKNPQKIVVGDHNGVITCFGMKRGDSQLIFKTLPDPSSPISNVQLNGVPGTVTDRIFVSCGGNIKGFSKKGKPFLNFDSNLTEPVRSMYVEGSHLMIAGSYVYNHYIDCADTNYYLSSDIINSIICLPTLHTSELVPILACQDCALRVLKGSDLLYELEVAGPPTTVVLNENDGGKSGRGLLYGTSDGRLGLVNILDDAPEYCWDMLNEHKYGSIVSIGCYDITNDGTPDILLGRADGIAEIYSMDENNQPRIRYTHAFNESVTSVCGGVVATPTHPELIVSTYNGTIHSMTTDPGVRKRGGAGLIRSEVIKKLDLLKKEVTDLEEQVSSAYKDYKSSVNEEGGKGLAVLPLVPINNSFTLNREESWYTLIIELQMPIDTLLFQCDVPVDLQEVERSTAVMSYSPPNPKVGIYLLATLRCCSNTTRVELKVRSIEGQYGTLNVYVTPKMEPPCARLLSYPIKPLSLHQRTHSFDTTLPCNTLHIVGQFSLSDIHSWISFCLPDVPNMPTEGETVTLHFKSYFTLTQLQCTYKEREAVFKTDNISTVSVLKEVISKEATKKNRTVKITHNINDDSAVHLLSLIYPKLEEQLMLAKNVQLIEALQELKIHEKDVSFLSPQCQFILDNAAMMQEDVKRQPTMIDRYYALISDLFMDRAGFKGMITVQQKVPELLSLLDECNYESLIQFFEENK